MISRSTLAYGFKAKAERSASDFRKSLQLHVCAPLCAFKLSEYLDIPIYKATEFLTQPEEIARLSGTNENDCGWSALTMQANSGKKIIIHNTFHSPARQQSDIMHELAHIICEHQHPVANYDFEIPLGMRYFDETQEEEASYLGAALQISRPALLWAKKRNMDTTEIAKYFNASEEMVTYRLNTTGVAKQSYFKKKTKARVI